MKTRGQSHVFARASSLPQLGRHWLPHVVATMTRFLTDGLASEKLIQFEDQPHDFLTSAVDTSDQIMQCLVVLPHPLASYQPVDGAELDLVVGVDFHQEPLRDVAVQAPDCEVGIVGDALDGRRVLHAGRMEREKMM